LNRTAIGLVWLGGLVLTLLLYAIGPLSVLAALHAFVVNFWDALDALIARLEHEALDAVRAAAIALYVVFVVLGVMALRQRLRAAPALAIVSVLFLVLAEGDWYDPGTKWFTAALLAGAGAAVMTSRLLRGPPPPRTGQPWTQRGFYRNDPAG
jgi:hypothetical protein